MATMTITHPITNKATKVRAWDVNASEASKMIRAEGVKAFSWSLLSQKHSVRAMEATDGGDSASNNFALNVLENALDWSLGLGVLNFLRAAIAQKKCPRTFKVAASRKGDVFVIVAKKDGGQWVGKF